MAADRQSHIVKHRMDAPLAKKTCKMCFMEIPQQARKCPHCHHFQNRWSMVMFHPAFAVCFACLPIAAMLIAFAIIFDKGENYEAYKDQIVISDSQIAFGDTKSGATVAVIGTIKNTSQVSWMEIQFHVDFLDAAGKRTDVGERKDNYFRLPAGETSSFKVSFRPPADEDRKSTRLNSSHVRISYAVFCLKKKKNKSLKAKTANIVY